MKKYEIYIAYVAWEGNGKNRPVLCLKTDRGLAYAYKITTKFDNKNFAVRKRYYKIKYWKKAGLNQQSYIDTNNIISFSAAEIESRPPIGKLTEYDKKALLDFIQNDT
ncbi:MAG: hypothetical protein LBL98_07905 [Ruminococcus sp.]|jgi:hypothetical protein|nr:hypothetical protein [Ruminococcus sp.]